MFEGLTKKLEQKKQKKQNISPSARDKALGEEVPSPSVGIRHSGKRSPSPSAFQFF
jgi:hypothetical protein